MTVPVLVVSLNGQFRASVVGSAELQCIRSSPAEAVAALRGELAQRVAAGELLSLEIQPLGVSGLSGRFKDDPTLRDLCDEIYRDRDAQQTP